MAMVRLHKFLANCGIASRRKAEQLMFEGRVSVNGSPALEPGTHIDPDNDRITVDGKLVRGEKRIYIILNKPRGYVTTVDDDRGRRTVMDLIDGVDERIYPVGRLDRDSEGLLVLTNDGDLTNYLTHPGNGVYKTYRCVIDGFITDETLQKIREGVRIGGRPVVPRKVSVMGRSKRLSRVEVEIGEGLNREVRRIFASVDHEVRKLKRLQVGPLTLEGLPKGRARFLTKKELNALRRGMVESGILEEEEIRKKPARKDSRSGGGKGQGRGGKSSGARSHGSAQSRESRSRKPSPRAKAPARRPGSASGGTGNGRARNISGRKPVGKPKRR